MDCGVVEERLENGEHVNYSLLCEVKCPKTEGETGVKCRARSSTDSHGVTRRWCVCSNHDAKPNEEPEPEECHIVLIITPAKEGGKATRTIACAGSCKGEGKECPQEPVKLKEQVNKETRVTVITWGCPCQKKKPKGEDKGKSADMKAPKKPVKKKSLKKKARR